MTERPMLFSAPMVRAILEGRKTQTRRIVKPQPSEWAKYPQPVGDAWDWTDRDEDSDSLRHWPDYYKPLRCPYGKPGDRLWVRETWRHTASDLDEARRITEDITSGTAVDYRATYIETCMRELGFTQADAQIADDLETWRHARQMPRWASRITLEITEVRVERLNAITGMDARREGVDVPPWIPQDGADLDWARKTFIGIWESLHGPDSWPANPWVWVVEFRRSA